MSACYTARYSEEPEAHGDEGEELGLVYLIKSGRGERTPLVAAKERLRYRYRRGQSGSRESHGRPRGDDPEDMSALILRYQSTCASAIGRFGGFVAKFMGDGVLVYFGYPQAHGDDVLLLVEEVIQ